jgi:hypothetical protein
VFQALAYLHALLLRLCLWLLKLPFKALLATLAAVLALLGEEARRWAGMLMAGLLIFLAGKVTMNYAPPELKRPLAMTVLVLVAIWSLAAMRAARFTMANNLLRVRQRQMFRQLAGDVGQLGDRLQTMRGEVVEGVARRARGTVAEGVFQSNRAKRAEEQAAAEATAERAERERAAAAEWDQAVAAKRAERERFAAEAAQRWTNRQREGA